MPAQWAAVDDMVEQYAAMLRTTECTTADIALDILASDKASEKRVLAMIAATALQRLAHHDR